jgi:hypothetical protein
MVDITVGAIPPVQNNSQKGKDPRRQASKKRWPRIVAKTSRIGVKAFERAWW